jgi:hypothetical protein
MLTKEERSQRIETRRTAREEQRQLAEIEAEKNQKPVESITISIEWKKSKMWGSNPHAEAHVTFKDGTHERQAGFTCSGCGYDKESTVIAQIFNRYLKYKLWKKTVEECRRKDHDWRRTGGAPYGVTAGKNEKTEYRGFSGRIGTGCYPAISEFIGGAFVRIVSGEIYDVWKYTDGDDK